MDREYMERLAEKGRKRIEESWRKTKREIPVVIERFSAEKSLSADMRKALENLHSSTVRSSAATLEKIQICESAYDLLHNSETVRSNPGIYIAAEYDLELPLLLGIRHIVLVDPAYAKKEAMSRLHEKASAYSTPVALSGLESRFMFDFGSGKEEVRLRLVPKPAGGFAPDFRHGLFLEYLGPKKSFFFAQYPLENLLVGGFALNDSPSSSLGKAPEAMKYGLVHVGSIENIAFYQKVADTDDAKRNIAAMCAEKARKEEEMARNFPDLSKLRKCPQSL